MTILITGGAGYIGGHMGLRLADRGEDFVVVDDMSNGVPWAVPDGTELVVASTGDYQRMVNLMRARKVDTILHFAATLITPDLYDKPLEYYRINAANGRALLQAAADAGVKTFIYSATSAVYGNPVSNPVSEEAAIAPTTPYGKSKLTTEHMLADSSAATGMRYVALRYFNVAGADPQGRTGQSTAGATHLIKVACEAATGKRDGVSVFGTDFDTPDGTGVRDYIHVSDLAAAHVLALEALIERPDRSLTMNCGYGRGFSVLEVLDAVDRVTNVTIERRMEPRRAGDPGELVSDPSRIRATLPWEPQYADLDQIITHAVQWERKLAEIRREA